MVECDARCAKARGGGAWIVEIDNYLRVFGIHAKPEFGTAVAFKCSQSHIELLCRIENETVCEAAKCLNFFGFIGGRINVDFATEEFLGE
jgi:hypothetical protein